MYTSLSWAEVETYCTYRLHTDAGQEFIDQGSLFSLYPK